MTKCEMQIQTENCEVLSVNTLDCGDGCCTNGWKQITISNIQIKQLYRRSTRKDTVDRFYISNDTMNTDWKLFL